MVYVSIPPISSSDLRKSLTYSPWDVYNSKVEIRNIMDSLINGFWSNGNYDKYRMIFDEIMYRNDEYFILKDIESYHEAFMRICELYQDKTKWVHSCAINIAMSGYFSSDRTIEQYAKEIWHLQKVDD